MQEVMQELSGRATILNLTSETVVAPFLSSS